MRRRFRFVFLPALTAVLAFAETRVLSVRVTPTQALVQVHTDQPGPCSYRISEAPSLSTLVNDVNPALFPGSNLDDRDGSIVQDTDHWFVAGSRTAAPGPDNKWVSRALAADTTHYGGVTCGVDNERPFRFTTENIPLGNTFTDPIPFDSRALGNYALPTYDFTDLAKSYVDPQTGFRYRLLSGPGMMPETKRTLAGALGQGDSDGNVPGAASGTNWTTPANGLLTDGQFAAYTAAGQDILTLRLASSCSFGECGGYNWSIANGNSSGYHTTSIDAYQLALTGNGNGSAIQVDVALSWNGVSQGTEWQTVTLPAATGTATYPAALTAGLAAWQGATYPLIPAMYWQVIQQRISVNTSGTGVTSASGPLFSLDPRVLTAGSTIRINGVEYSIASVDSATHLTLTATAGEQNGVTAYVANFSVLIRKHTASAGTVRIDGATVAVPVSNSFGNGGSGFQNACSHLTSMDQSGKVGRFCIFQSLQGESGIFWVTDDLSVRFIGRALIPASSIGVSADEYRGAFYNGQSLFDTTNPNSWWISTTLVSTGRVTLVKATYNPSGVSGCVKPANYQTLAPNANYDTASSDNCNITFTELTRPSQGKDIWSQLPAILKSGKFGTTGPGLSFIQSGLAVMLANGGSQDSESWIISIDLATGIIKGAYSSYMNADTCRACVLHGTGPSTPAGDTFYLIFNNYVGGNGASGAGPYNFLVDTPLTTTPSNPLCAGVTDPRVAWMIPYSAGCDDITLAGGDNIPCDPNPSAWEAANMPPCSWQSGWTQWQAGAIKPGDWLQDPNVGFEVMVFAALKNGSTWTIIRNVNLPQGPLMVQVPGVNENYLRNHSVGWTAALRCSFYQNAFARVTETDGSGLIWDRKFYSFSHGVLRPAGMITAEFFNDINDFGISVRTGSFPAAANTPETARVLNRATFSGKNGLGGTDFLQSHVGWDGNIKSFTDMAPMAAPQGGNFTLWPQPGVTNISGSLYKIPAANAYIAHDKRRRATAVWSGMFNFLDISGTGSITGDPADNYHYCSIDYAGATCGQADESVGDVFLNIPQASIDGLSGGSYDLNRPNAIPLGQEPLAVLQYYFDKLTGGVIENLGRWSRRITTGGGRYNGQDTYSNAKLIFNSDLLLFNCGSPNMQRIQELCVGHMPSDPPLGSFLRNDFGRVTVEVEPGAQYAEVQFGYAENGLPGQFYCTSRKEACNTSSPAGVPYNWEGEARVLKDCSLGCSIQTPVIPDRMLYYRVRSSNDGTTWSDGPLQVSVGP